MRILCLLDADSALIKAHGQSVPAWAAACLQQHGFDLAQEIIYRYEPSSFSTLFMQHQCPAERMGYAAQAHVDSEYSEDAVWMAAVEQLAQQCEEAE